MGNYLATKQFIFSCAKSIDEIRRPYHTSAGALKPVVLQIRHLLDAFDDH